MKAIAHIIIIMTWVLSAASQSTINYTASADDFPNPERGFYRYASTHSASYNPLNAATLASYRNPHTPPTAGYNIVSSLVYRVFYLEDFVAADISASYLSNVQADFAAARAAGVKLIVRFAYTNQVDGSSCANWICPPYGDAPKARVLSHITQLAPILSANKDVIAVVQMGWIGTWGEGYYTDYFGDASQSPYILTAENWDDRAEVLNAYLAALPANRMIQVRYPQKKQKTLYGSAAPTSSPAITAAQAHNGSTAARIGFHNDCLLASHTDFGTYNNYGPPTSLADTTTLKPYLTEDSKYVAVGGETCSEYAPFDNCAADGGRADTALERFHYSYLNSQYNNAVNNGWTSTCMDDIKRKLGYRLALVSGTYSDEAQPGQTISLDMDIRNEGYAAPFNPRAVEVLLRHSVSGDLHYAALPDDPRFWLPGTHNVNATLCLPADMPTGNYELLLNLADPEPSLYSRPEYAIRLANTGTWEAATGYNNLLHTITVNGTAAAPACSGETVFAGGSTFLPVELLEFKAEAENGGIRCLWRTASEEGNRGFHLQRSRDARAFEDIAWLDSRGEQGADYDYLDKDAKKGQTYYYRLRQADWDGTEGYSMIIQAQRAASAEWARLYPNPAGEVIHLAFALPERADVEIRIHDFSGKLLERRLFEDIQGETLPYPVSHLPKGCYIISMGYGGDWRSERVLVW